MDDCGEARKLLESLGQVNESNHFPDVLLEETVCVDECNNIISKEIVGSSQSEVQPPEAQSFVDVQSTNCVSTSPLANLDENICDLGFESLNDDPDYQPSSESESDSIPDEIQLSGLPSNSQVIIYVYLQ